MTNKTRRARKGSKAQSPWRHVQTHRFGVGTIEEYILTSNGLTLLFHEDTQAPVFSYHTWFRVGSRHEKVGKTGLAHFFEHLMFGETKKIPPGGFDSQLEASGAESNAATWVDWTFYHVSLPNDGLGLIAGLEAERMQNLVLREPQVASERDVVMNERRFSVEDDVDGSVAELLYKTAFEKHPYKWPTIGWMKDIKRYTPKDCEDFYKTYYAPNNATVVICGDLRISHVLSTLEKAYSGLKASAIPAEDFEPEPVQTKERRARLKRPTSLEKVVWGYKSPALGDLDHATLTVLSEILFGGRSSIAYDQLVLKEKVATDVHGWAATFRYPGLFEVHATAREKKSLGTVSKALEKVLAAVKKKLVTDAQVARAVARLELTALQGMQTVSGKAEQIGFNATVLGDPTAALEQLKRYRRVTPSDIRIAARKYLNSTSRTEILLERGSK